MDYIDYKFIQASLTSDNYRESINIYFNDDYKSYLSCIKKFVDSNYKTGYFNKEISDNLYTLVSDIREEVKSTHKEDINEVTDICNHIIEKLNNVDYNLNLEYCIDECCSRALFKNEQIMFNMDFFKYDFYNLVKVLVEEFDLKEFSMNEVFLHSISSIIEENIGLIYNSIFMQNVLSVIDYNFEFGKNDKKIFKQTIGLINKINYISEHFKDLCEEVEEIDKKLEYYIKNSGSLSNSVGEQ